MAIETEKKYRLDKPAMVAMADKLRELGAVFVSERFEQNFIYRNGIPDETNAVLRIRKIGESTFLTYKERIRNESEFKTKIEHETLVSDAEGMEFIVAKLGYKLVVVYEKHRKTFHLGECEVVLDELPFGQYMEIEGEPGRKNARCRGVSDRNSRLFAAYGKVRQRRGRCKDRSL